MESIFSDNGTILYTKLVSLYLLLHMLFKRIKTTTDLL